MFYFRIEGVKKYEKYDYYNNEYYTKNILL